MKNPRAFTLAEMLVCISLGSVLMGLALGIVHRTMRTDSSARSSAQVERTAALLSRQFRHDIHRTQVMSCAGLQSERPTVELMLAGESPITYRLEQNLVFREQQQTSSQLGRELFAFPADYALHLTELSNPPRAVLTLQHDTQLMGVSPQVKLHVEAVVGQFLRLSRTEEVPE